MKNIKEYLKAEDVEFFLANTPQITFEVTDACNLRCTYCGYGEFYSDYDKRGDKMLPVSKAFRLLDYVNALWNSPKNISYNRNVYISFYGGEPLLNMNFIQKVVEYIENMNCKTRTFTFSMTTNALLLRRYMDFFVEKNFHTLISLDGNRENTGYRVDKNGKEAFDRIISNIDSLKEKYPDYFKKYVNYNAVLHNRNSVESIYAFIKEKYNKIPSIRELNNSGIRKEKIKEFEKAYVNTVESLSQSEHYTEIMKDMALQLGTYQTVGIYLMQYSNFVYKDYNELLYGKPNLDSNIPTGTCMPFSKKVFVTVNGKLLPCERIGHQFSLGKITDNEIEIDFEYIAQKYNTYYAKLDKQCKACHNRQACIQCIYNLPDLDKKPQCHGFMNLQEFQRYQNTQINFLANNPEEYYRIMEEIVNV
jgi:uncharacterized protein